jgi:thiamine-phosphate pyrophosphorylase
MARSSSVIRGYYAIVETPEQALPLLGYTRIVQLRNKRAGAQELLSAARKLRELTRKSGVAFCVNDRVDIALLAQADAVHLGQDDLPLSAARNMAGDRLIIGVSTHSAAQAREALAGGADYIGFGPVFATASKDHPDPVQGLDALAEIVGLAGRIPVVAIGGITPKNIAAVVRAGASAAAAIASVLGAADPVTAAKQMVEAGWDSSGQS